MLAGPILNDARAQGRGRSSALDNQRSRPVAASLWIESRALGDRPRSTYLSITFEPRPRSSSLLIAHDRGWGSRSREVAGEEKTGRALPRGLAPSTQPRGLRGPTRARQLDLRYRPAHRGPRTSRSRLLRHHRESSTALLSPGSEERRDAPARSTPLESSRPRGRESARSTRRFTGSDRTTNALLYKHTRTIRRDCADNLEAYPPRRRSAPARGGRGVHLRESSTAEVRESLGNGRPGS